MSSNHTDYIITALKSGFTETQIAQGLGVTPSAVHQTIQEKGLKDIAAENSQFKSIDDRYNRLEELALRKMEKSLELAVLNPMQLTRVVNTLNGAKRRSLSEGQTIINQNNTQLVNLKLPERYAPKVVKNENNEVIEVNDRVYSTMHSTELDKFKEQQSRRLDQTQEEEVSYAEDKQVSDYL